MAQQAITAAATAAGPGAWQFTTAQQRQLGRVNYDARDDSPERFTPKTTLADGHRQSPGDFVADERRRLGTVAKTYQTHCAVRWLDTGRLRTVHNSKLNAAPRAAVARHVETVRAAAELASAERAAKRPRRRRVGEQFSVSPLGVFARRESVRGLGSTVTLGDADVNGSTVNVCAEDFERMTGSGRVVGVHKHRVVTHDADGRSIVYLLSNHTYGAAIRSTAVRSPRRKRASNS